MVFYYNTLSKFKKLQKKNILFIVCTLLALTFIMYLQACQTENFQQLYQMNKQIQNFLLQQPGREKYLIDTPKCKIVQTDIINPEIVAFTHPEDYVSCSDGKPPLTYIQEDEYFVTLNINKSAMSSYAYFTTSCCYSVITRDYTLAKPDDSIRISECQPFDTSVEITKPFIQVSCRNLVGKELYKNVHAVVTPKFLTKQDAPVRLNLETTFSVLLVGIDSISKSNLERAMPKTSNFLQQNQNFINMRGFVKVGFNTIPNLMAMLGGLSISQIKECPYRDYVDKCDNIWKVFRQKGYITAYAEDNADISTFNYEKKGFHAPPTDLYFRPYILAAERLGGLKKRWPYCAGPESEAERIMQLARDFQVNFKDDPKFGLFWMNSFSHNDFNMPSSMDDKVEEFLGEITKHLDNTIFFFFSDHGIRFGQVRQTSTGWLEERIPFSYLYLPDTFKKRFRKEYNNVVTNSRRLTNFYDMYMTLQDVLFFADSTYEIRDSRGCPLCRSLLQEVSEQRTCEDAAIHKKWCVCQASLKVNLTENDIFQLATAVVRDINYRLANSTDLCSTYTIGRIDSGRIAESGHIIVTVKTVPEAVFEGIFSVGNSSSQLELIAIPDRVDSYDQHSKCVEDVSMKVICYCRT